MGRSFGAHGHRMLFSSLIPLVSCRFAGGALLRVSSPRCFSSLRGGAGASPLHKPVKCVIFDKDGTLISFHHTWSPWADRLIERLVKRCAASGVCDERSIRSEVAETLGYDLDQRCVRGESSLLAWAAQPLIYDAIRKCLEDRLGLLPDDAAAATHTCWSECDGKEEVVALSNNTQELLSRLRARGIKIAVCTSDARVPTEANLASLGIVALVDEIVCGDDASNVPKPAPDNILNICKKLGVLPIQTIMIGDTNADLKMALASNAGLSVAVLSGVGSRQDLSPNAHVILNSIDEVESLL
mmetsp:Transcript_3698/g.3217  ORF Transcript_3698/g.3217 Transcript_3698/m.3217 type:complete len:299 (-) Transcript_3698:320-1216(-)